MSRQPEEARLFDFRWLIEAPGQRYLIARKLGSSREFTWSQDHNSALCFMSEEQADAAMMAIRQLSPDLFEFAETLGDARAVEHGWLGSGLTKSAWQPISTAPKDGTRIFGWAASDSSPYCILWGVNPRGAPAWTTSFAAFHEGYITHWKPLDAPAASLTDGDAA